jgi:hypothetical protein
LVSSSDQVGKNRGAKRHGQKYGFNLPVCHASGVILASANHSTHVDKLTISMARDTGELLQHGAFNHARIVRSVFISLLHYVRDMQCNVGNFVQSDIGIGVKQTVGCDQMPNMNCKSEDNDMGKML